MTYLLCYMVQMNNAKLTRRKFFIYNFTAHCTASLHLQQNIKPFLSGGMFRTLQSESRPFQDGPRNEE